MAGWDFFKDKLQDSEQDCCFSKVLVSESSHVLIFSVKMHVMMQATILMFLFFKIVNDVVHDLIKANYVEAPFKIILKVSLSHLQQLVDNLNLLDLANGNLENEVYHHLSPELHIRQSVVDALYNLNCMVSDKFWIKLVDQLTGNAQELAIDGLSLNISEFVLKEYQEQLKYFGKGLRVLSRVIELQQMQKRQIGIKPTIVVDIDFLEWIVVNTCILKHLGMILTGYIVDNLFVVQSRPQDWTV